MKIAYVLLSTSLEGDSNLDLCTNRGHSTLPIDRNHLETTALVTTVSLHNAVPECTGDKPRDTLKIQIGH